MKETTLELPYQRIGHQICYKCSLYPTRVVSMDSNIIGKQSELEKELNLAFKRGFEEGIKNSKEIKV